MTGTVGTVAVTAGPGLTNTVTAIKNAQMAESPILLLGWFLKYLFVLFPCNKCHMHFLIGGAAATILKGRGALQDIDQMSLFKPLCKYCVSVTSIRDIAPVLRTALQVAQSDTPGTVTFILLIFKNELQYISLIRPFYKKWKYEVNVCERYFEIHLYLINLD